MQTPVYTIRRSARVKLARIVVSSNKIEVVAPMRMPKAQIIQFVTAKQDWIETAIAKVQQQVLAIPRMSPEVYGQGALIPYEGRHYHLVLKTTPLKRVKVQFNAAFEIDIPATLDPLNQNSVIRSALSAWMKNSLKLKIQQYIDLHAPKFQLFPRLVRIKTQKSRWGSCTSNNDININWLLILAPPAVLEYVVVHELCHIREGNHSADFWQLVAQHLPDYQQQQQWLKQHGTSLMLGL